MTILTLLPLPIGIILAVALMWNGINFRNKNHKSMIKLERIRMRYEE